MSENPELKSQCVGIVRIASERLITNAINSYLNRESYGEVISLARKLDVSQLYLDSDELAYRIQQFAGEK